MRLGKYLSGLTKPELEVFLQNCNFSEEESIIFNMLSKNKSLTEISIQTGMSISTIRRRRITIQNKVERLYGGKGC